MSLALDADSVWSVLSGSGDGHPPLWYLLIRGAHALMPRPESLQILGITVGAAAMALFVIRSPFSLFFTALVLLSRFSLYEYSVMARNYGISMLFLFLLAMLFEKRRDRSIILGVLLFLLANCNVHSILLAGAFLVFWLADILLDTSRDRKEAFRYFAVNALIAIVGIGYSALTILHTSNDAITTFRPENLTAAHLIRVVLLPAESFANLVGTIPLRESLGEVATLALSAIMFGSILGLVRRPAAMAGALLSLMVFSLFFNIIYGGGYRHGALWLIFLLCMYWIAWQPNNTKEIHRSERIQFLLDIIQKMGLAAFTALLFLQVLAGINCIARAGYESQSRDLSALILKTPELKDAIVIADPDFLVEPLPYYVPNHTYLLREQRFGNVTWFIRDARLTLSLGEILGAAKKLHSDLDKAVIILLRQRLDPSHIEALVHEGYNWQLSMTTDQVQDFLASTRLIQGSSSRINGDESYDVYVLDR